MIVKELREVYEFPRGGNRPVRSQESRWISHKRKALQRVVDRYGAYISHLLLHYLRIVLSRQMKEPELGVI